MITKQCKLSALQPTLDDFVISFMATCTRYMASKTLLTKIIAWRKHHSTAD